jgi:hypothetical protein
MWADGVVEIRRGGVVHEWGRRQPMASKNQNYFHAPSRRECERTPHNCPRETYDMGKRKNQAQANGQAKKKRAISEDEAHKNFRNGLFEGKVRDDYTDYYAKSQPYDTILAFDAP